MSETKNFPKGFKSWQETHYEIVAAIQECLAEKPDESVKSNWPAIDANIVWSTDDKEGCRGLYVLAEQMTDQFETEFKDVDWQEGDYLDEIYKFILTALK